jgi:hypothetical protein
MYHKLGDESGLYTTETSTFYGQLRLLVERGYQNITLQQLVAFGHREQEVPPRSVIITFDDNYPDVIRYLAVPTVQQVARETGVPFKIVWALVPGSRDWSYFDDESFSWMRRLEWEGWLDVQSHSASHRPLAELVDQPDELRYELLESRLTLEEKLSGSLALLPAGGESHRRETPQVVHVTKKVIAFFPPYGSGVDDPRLLEAAYQAGYQCVIVPYPAQYDRPVMLWGDPLFPVGRVGMGTQGGYGTVDALARLLDDVQARYTLTLEESILARKLAVWE